MYHYYVYYTCTFYTWFCTHVEVVRRLRRRSAAANRMIFSHFFFFPSSSRRIVTLIISVNLFGKKKKYTQIIWSHRLCTVCAQRTRKKIIDCCTLLRQSFFFFFFQFTRSFLVFCKFPRTKIRVISNDQYVIIVFPSQSYGQRGCKGKTIYDLDIILYTNIPTAAAAFFLFRTFTITARRKCLFRLDRK